MFFFLSPKPIPTYGSVGLYWQFFCSYLVVACLRFAPVKFALRARI
jgi:hypothetical protein